MEEMRIEVRSEEKRKRERLRVERDYIKVYPINGCFSLIGYAQQGGQILSIDKGCERTTTMIHEFMHGLGINHEQTRPDRDDYITVNYDVIQPPLGFNFWRLGYNRNARGL
ncbi:Oidioi.mRNA.OKI2018_I69.chr1.g3084.t1.cds [Oikopleura dioica]|uniref:Metalloendopeptidase n=1 Tax=Oikopleura dioica TaxID=34765 RepID=A0ABN7STP6_OIKDI|nr:Oidioi.mRNA.OKI2018_I69.chr1.g3084.t1.cds [Oikopleura dioica]